MARPISNDLRKRVLDDVLALAHTQKHAVLDADALTCFENDTLRFYKALHGQYIFTPARGEVYPDLTGDKLIHTQTETNLTNAVILLKGPDTIIAAKGRTPVINTCGTPYLATAGSGDVLAGIIVGLLAQGMNAFEATCAGAWTHGKAAEKYGAGLTAPDIIASL